ncbi:olfactory receptor 1J4-like [Hyperolius riggenbachi]|uniref:olfactory receptor 1J4-like n=1 Tax=Hyperolius riggenbachi TaxID=752182 RepID=UPI0035A2E65E
MKNCTNSSVSEFSILAFVTSPNGQILLFILVLLMYFFTVLGNATIVTLVSTVSQLHTPMYFFLCNLSSADITYVSVTLPKLMSILLSQDHSITFYGCMAQLYIFLLCAQADIFILTSMAYDRYVAICKPLQYSLIMNKSVCITMAAFSWLTGTLNSLPHTMIASSLSYCYSNEIDHFFCDLKTLSKLSASDFTNWDLLSTVESVFIGCIPFLLIVISYVYIIVSILKIQTSKGRHKAFSSCTSHLITVLLFYGPIIFIYIKPTNNRSSENDKLLSIIYIAIVPLLNPLVYSLRNKDVLVATAKIRLYVKFRSVQRINVGKKHTVNKDRDIWNC